MTNRCFDTIRLCCEIILPAIATCYAALGSIWGWPYIEGVTGSLAAVAVCVGTILAGLRDAYNKKQEEKDE